MNPTTELSAASLAARHDLMGAADRFYGNGWLFGTAGNLSARFGRSVVITASGCDKGGLGEGNFVELGLDGEVLAAPPDRKPSAEASIHLALYARMPSVNAILHVHTPASTKLKRGDRRAVEFKGLEMLKGWGLWEEDAVAHLPLFENHGDVSQIAAEVEAHFEKSRRVPALVIESHGITAWGATVAEARRHVEITEFLCRLETQ
jgi:methylthioribulose-1-phosphate dehydratase